MEKHLSKKERRQLKRQQKQEAREREARRRKARKISKWIVTIGVIGLAVILIVVLASRGGGEVDLTVDESGISDSDWVKGNPEGAITLVEYSDFQCPACASYFPLVKELLEENDDVRFVYRHFPLTNIHANAERAARASEAAGMQGKFWEMHDLLFDRQNAWSTKFNSKDIFVGYAEELGLDVVLFLDFMNDNESRDLVRDDINRGNRAGVQGTPTFFVNGEQISNPRGLEDFRSSLGLNSN